MRRRRILIAVAGAVVVGGFLAWFPSWALARAHRHAIDCTRAIYRSGTGAASDCEQGGLLAIPKLIPWTRSRALAEEASIHAQALEDALELAVKRDLDRAAAARGVTALFTALAAAPALDRPHAVSYVVKRAGVDRALIDHAGELPESGDQYEAMIAAIHAGDRDAVLRIAALPAKPTGSYALENARGAVLCAFADRSAGTAALARANAIYESFSTMTTPLSGGYPDAQLGLAACDPTTQTPIDEVWRGRYRFARQLGGAPAEPLDDRYNDDADLPSLVALDRSGDDRMADYLAIVAPAIGGPIKPRYTSVSAWSILSSEPEYPSAPGWEDATAERLIAMADAHVAPKPTTPRDTAIADLAEVEPRGYLRWGAMVVALDAAVGWVRRGDAAHALASVDTAVACAHHAETIGFQPDADLALVPVLQLVGRDADALAIVDGLVAKQAQGWGGLRGVLAVQKVLLLLRAGKPADAWTVFDPAVVLASPDPGPTWTLAWLRAATAVMLDKPLDIELPAVPDQRDYASDHPDIGLAYWYTAATDPSVQPIRRWRQDGLDPGYFDSGTVLPALLYVVGKAAGTGDVELWLDAVTANEVIPWEALAAARAEAARWRGDAAAATAWDQRLAAYRALATDDRSAYLLRLAQRH